VKHKLCKQLLNLLLQMLYRVSLKYRRDTCAWNKYIRHLVQCTSVSPHKHKYWSFDNSFHKWPEVTSLILETWGWAAIYITFLVAKQCTPSYESFSKCVIVNVQLSYLLPFLNCFCLLYFVKNISFLKIILLCF
jgi:hypothetical protein